MPESVTDRPTRSHEYLFLLAKSGTSTFWTHRDHNGSQTRPAPDYRWVHPETREESDTEQSEPWRRINLWRGHDYFYDAEAVRDKANPLTQRSEPVNATESTGNMGGNKRTDFEKIRHLVSHRNKRTVWTIATEPFSAAHFATFPRKLVEPCIVAGTSTYGHCPAEGCGARWVRVVERENEGDRRARGLGENEKYNGAYAGFKIKPGVERSVVHSKTTGFRPTCDHNLEPVPDVVLDCFAGSGTVAVVAQKLGRRFITIELNPAYDAMIEERTRQGALDLVSSGGHAYVQPESIEQDSECHREVYPHQHDAIDSLQGSGHEP